MLKKMGSKFHTMAIKSHFTLKNIVRHKFSGNITVYWVNEVLSGSSEFNFITGLTRCNPSFVNHFLTDLKYPKILHCQTRL